LKIKDFLRVIRLLDDYLKRRDEIARTVLPKMAAEARCCDNLSAGSLLTGLLVLAKCIAAMENWLPCLTEVSLFSVICIVSAMAARRRYRAFLSRQLSYFSLE
jgi:hypothetical protein